MLYYYGDHVPNFAQHKRTDPAKVQPGYDYDVISEEAVLARASVRDGRIVLPDGASYRVLVLPARDVISLPVLRKVAEWTAAGATVVGPVQPTQASGLKDAAEADAEVRSLAGELWASDKVVSGQGAREVLREKGLGPDVDFDVPAELWGSFDFIHRRDGEAEIYFLANRSTNAVAARCSFRVAGKVPELWDPVSGARRAAAVYGERDGRVSLPLDFAPCGSWFVVFRNKGSAVGEVHGSSVGKGEEKTLLTVDGSWDVAFDPKWLGPEVGGQRSEVSSFAFKTLQDWTQRPEPGIKYYSGTAVYRKTINIPSPDFRSPTSLLLDLGQVRELAEVRVNGQPCGVVWAPPFRADITKAAKAGANELEIRVINFWFNRVFGDQSLPSAQRLTRTNIKKLQNPGTPLMPSGLLGPVSVVSGAR